MSTLARITYTIEMTFDVSGSFGEEWSMKDIHDRALKDGEKMLNDIARQSLPVRIAVVNQRPTVTLISTREKS